MTNIATPLVIPIFVTHQGCPHRCLFCNQRPITGAPEPACTAESVAAEINTWLTRSHRRRYVQVAFYGGSFTGMEVDVQRQLLSAVQPFIKSGQVDGIRLSTRPDYVSRETPGFLRGYGVQTVELGAQAMDQGVLDRSLRGHSVHQVETAIATLRKAGLRTGVQLMLGLPGETTQSAIAGAKRLAALRPDFARLYPALVIMGSGLEALFHKGHYQPLSLPRAVVLAARMLSILEQGGVPVVRTGLQPSRELEASLVAGPYHPAFGELVKARIFFNEVRRQLTPFRGRPCRLEISAQDRSLFSGQRKVNLARLQALGLLDQATVMFTDMEGKRGGVRVQGDRLTSAL